MAEFGTKERILKTDLTMEECKRVERILRQNNISYFERWKSRKGLFRMFDKGNSGKCDILVHMDSLEKARAALEENNE